MKTILGAEAMAGATTNFYGFAVQSQYVQTTAKVACALTMMIVLCTSCASVYVPSVRNVPLLSKRGEFQLSGSTGSGVNLNTACALTNHIGLMGNAMFANDKWQGTGIYSIHQSAEAGLGYFGNKKQFSYELYAGYGGGKGYSRDLIFGFLFLINTLKITSGSYDKAFVQPTFAFKIKRFQMAITTRVTRIDFDRLSINEDDREKDMPRKRFYLYEPSFTSKFIIKRGCTSVFAFAQTGYNASQQHKENESSMPYSVLHYNVGIRLKL